MNKPVISSLTNQALEAGRIYKARGGISSQMLRSEIYRAWERAHLQGANPCALKPEKLSELETERLIQKHIYIIHAVRPYFHYLSQAVGKERHAIMLSDREAIVLDLAGDEQTVNDTEAFPQPGSLLSEAVAGTNGIGTSLAEENYVEIFASEHFIEGFHAFTCQGIPLRNEKSEIVGILSISTRNPDTAPRLKEIFLCASYGIQAEYLTATLEKDIHQVLTSHPGDYQQLEKLHQDIIQAHQATRLKLEIGSRMIAVNRLDNALQILQQAETSIQIFRRRANVWRNLASSEIGKLQPLSLNDSVTDLVELLLTEAAIRKLEVITDWQQQIIVIADSQRLLRQMLRYFLEAFDSAGKGGTIKVAVTSMPNSDLAQVSFTSIPGLNILNSEPRNYIFSLPITNKNL
jgi:sigma-54 dependent transcriptional regulator, acetoin dehydrogenase operon transcriptional activator AcoR